MEISNKTLTSVPDDDFVGEDGSCCNVDCEMR